MCVVFVVDQDFKKKLSHRWSRGILTFAPTPPTFRYPMTQTLWVPRQIGMKLTVNMENVIECLGVRDSAIMRDHPRDCK